MNQVVEIWKSLKNYEGYYEISNLGRLKSLKRLVDYGKIKAIRPEKILSFRKGKYGYLYTIISVNNIRKTIKPHRLVAENFLENPNNYPQVNHKDGNKLNNAVDNLEWCTAKTNIIHAVNNNLKKGKRGEQSHFCKLSDKQVLEIRKIKKEVDISNKELGKWFNVSTSQIQRICNRTNRFNI